MKILLDTNVLIDYLPRGSLLQMKPKECLRYAKTKKPRAVLPPIRS